MLPISLSASSWLAPSQRSTSAWSRPLLPLMRGSWKGILPCMAPKSLIEQLVRSESLMGHQMMAWPIAIAILVSTVSICQFMCGVAACCKCGESCVRHMQLEPAGPIPATAQLGSLQLLSLQIRLRGITPEACHGALTMVEIMCTNMTLVECKPCLQCVSASCCIVA